MQETVQQYIERMLSHSNGQDPMRMQKAAPKKLAALIKGKKQAQLARRPAPDKWSVAEILAHLADAETAISWRLRHILTANGAPIQAYDQAAWANTFDYAGCDARESLERYRVLREANLALVKRVPKRLWENYGVHQERGNETITHIMRLTAGHDVNHRLQVEQILKGKR
jgi:uncharacterized damage-inducible protein DinB